MQITTSKLASKPHLHLKLKKGSASIKVHNNLLAKIEVVFVPPGSPAAQLTAGETIRFTPKSPENWNICKSYTFTTWELDKLLGDTSLLQIPLAMQDESATISYTLSVAGHQYHPVPYLTTRIRRGTNVYKYLWILLTNHNLNKQ